MLKTCLDEATPRLPRRCQACWLAAPAQQRDTATGDHYRTVTAQKNGLLGVTWPGLNISSSSQSSGSLERVQIMPSCTQQTDPLYGELEKHAVQQWLHRTES